MSQATKNNQNNQQQTLYHKLGGYQGLEKIVAQFFQFTLKDPIVNYYYLQYVSDIPKLHQLLTEKLSEMCDGPKLYSGRPMKQSHARMTISQQQFDAVWSHYLEAMKVLKIDEKLINDLRNRFYAYENLLVSKK